VTIGRSGHRAGGRLRADSTKGRPVPRREQTITAGGPLAAFAHELREVRHRAGSPTYREMGAAVRYSHSVLCRAASGRALPSWDATRAYLQACGMETEQLGDWRERHRRVKEALASPGAAADPAPDDTALRLLKQVTALVRSRNPGPASVRSPQDFGRAMRHLRLASDLSLREIARRTVEYGVPVQVSTLADLCEPGRRTWPEAEAVAAFLTAIGVADAQTSDWLDRLAALRSAPAAETRADTGGEHGAAAILDDAERVVRLLRERPLTREELAAADAVAAVAGVAILADDPDVGPGTDVFDRLYCHLSNALACPVDASASVDARLIAAHRQGREAQEAYAVLDAARGAVEQHALLEELARGRGRVREPVGEPGPVELERIRRHLAGAVVLP